MKKRPAHNIYSSGSYGIAHNTQIHNQTYLRLSPLHLGGRCGEPFGGVVDRRAKTSTGFMASWDTNFSGGRQTQCEAEIISFSLALEFYFWFARQTGSGCESIFASRLIRINATTEWTCSSTAWMDKCFEVPRRLCPVQRDRSWPCSAPQPASTSPPVQNANSHSERPHRRTIVPHRSISCEQRRCDQDHSLEQR